MSKHKRPLTAADLYKLKTVFDPQISPDGQLVIFCVRCVDAKTEKKFTNLWLVPTDASAAPRQFTVGDHNDSQPRWSPDGSQIAFLSNRADEKQAQLYLIAVDGGEARPLTALEGSFAQFAWSPDGTQIVAQFRKKDAAVIEREKDEQKKKLGIVVRHITHLEYKENGVGYAPQEQWHIWTIDLQSGTAAQLTDGRYAETEPRWTPDGKHILCVSNRSVDPALHPDGTELYLLPAAGGDLRQIVTRNGRKWLPTISPDGQWVSFMGREQFGKPYQNSSLYIAPINGGAVRNLTNAFDLHMSLVTITDSGSGSPQTPPVWSNDGRFLFCQTTTHGDQPLLTLTTADQPTIERLTTEPGISGGFGLDSAQTKVVYVWGTLWSSGQVWLKDLVTGSTRALTNFDADLFEEIEWGTIEEVAFKGPDDNDLSGWILKPPAFDPGQHYPSILEIHGGPMTQYGRGFMHEFHYFAANGYVVYWTNPRGGQGFGEAFSAAINNQWGTVDYADLMAWTDILQQQPYIDPERMAVTGGSYGGYMTLTIIGHTTRFKTAVAQRVVSNFISFYGSSDMNWLTENLLGSETTPWQDFDNYWQQSPISRIGSVTTPTLLIHSEQDMRCAQEQAEQVFVALQKRGIDAELVLFPDEEHGLSRSGRTDLRVARLEHMLRWFDTYL